MTMFDHRVMNPEGVHAKLASQLAEKVKQMPQTVQLVKDKKAVNAENLLAIVGLCIKADDIIQFKVSGEQEEQAAEELKKFVQETV
ncbi:MAG: HPr family phosphocarrier protein [Eubacteriales bacterium]|nr:HPr family phosphocarrier protein [Eubacteriales bacterium]